MDEEQILNQRIFEALLKYGLQDEKAIKIARKTTEKARRAKHSGPITRPGVLIDDRVASNQGILITIRKDSLEKIDPHKVLQDYVKEQKYKGEWKLGEAYGNLNSRVRVWKANSIAAEITKKTKKTEQDILKNFSKLSEEEQQKVLANLQK